MINLLKVFAAVFTPWVALAMAFEGDFLLAFFLAIAWFTWLVHLIEEGSDGQGHS